MENLGPWALRPKSPGGSGQTQQTAAVSVLGAQGRASAGLTALTPASVSAAVASSMVPVTQR